MKNKNRNNTIVHLLVHQALAAPAAAARRLRSYSCPQVASSATTAIKTLKRPPGKGLGEQQASFKYAVDNLTIRRCIMNKIGSEACVFLWPEPGKCNVSCGKELIMPLEKRSFAPLQF